MPKPGRAFQSTTISMMRLTATEHIGGNVTDHANIKGRFMALSKGP